MRGTWDSGRVAKAHDLGRGSFMHLGGLMAPTLAGVYRGSALPPINVAPDRRLFASKSQSHGFEVHHGTA